MHIQRSFRGGYLHGGSHFGHAGGAPRCRAEQQPRQPPLEPSKLPNQLDLHYLELLKHRTFLRTSETAWGPDKLHPGCLLRDEAELHIVHPME